MKKLLFVLISVLTLNSCKKDKVDQPVADLGFTVTPIESISSTFFNGYCWGNGIEELIGQTNSNNFGVKKVYLVSCQGQLTEDEVKADLLKRKYTPAGAGYLEGLIVQHRSLIPNGIMVSSIDCGSLKNRSNQPIRQMIFQTPSCWFSYTEAIGNNWNGGQIKVFYVCFKN